jgi:hypothetical protein
MNQQEIDIISSILTQIDSHRQYIQLLKQQMDKIRNKLNTSQASILAKSKREEIFIDFFSLLSDEDHTQCMEQFELYESYFSDKLNQATCNHEYIHDSIEINCERSENIVYCSKCYLNK